MKKNIICHLTSVHPYNDMRIYQKECRSLAAAGFETHLVAPNAPNGMKNGIHLHGINITISNRLERMTRLVWNIYQKARRIKAEIYHFHDPELILVGILLKLQGKKIIYDVHEDVPQQILSKDYLRGFRFIISMIFNYFEKYSAKMFDYIVTPTDIVTEMFIKATSNVLEVRNYAWKDNLIIENMVCKRGRVDNLLKIVFVGGIYGERGLEEVIQGINLLPNLPIKFLLYGFVENEYLEKLKKIDKYGRLIYLGVLPPDEVIGKMRECDIGIIYDHPLKRHIEGLPVKLFEYMAAGIPVIAPDYPLLKRIIEGNNCGTCIKPKDPEAVADAIKYLFENGNIRLMMGNNGKKAIMEKYNWEKESRKLIYIYNHILEINDNKFPIT